MGLARELTMGTATGRPRHKGAGRYPLGDNFTRLRALTKLTERTTGDPDPQVLEQVEALVREVSSLPRRLRFEEGAILNAACSAYQDATGRTIGPATGVL